MATSHAAAMDQAAQQATAEVLVARQPIFDRNLELHGYELLYRSMNRARADVQDNDVATMDVITSAFVDIGLERLLHDALGFVNVTRELLLTGDIEALPPQKLVIEILENQQVDEELLTAVSDLKAKGYRFALDDFEYTPSYEPLLKLADVVKVDFSACSQTQLRELAEQLKPYGATLLAEKLEDDDGYQLALELGFELFQGFFFAKPRIVSGQRLQGNKLAVLRLLAVLHDAEADIDAVAEMVGQDATLSYKLLRFINSSALALPQKVESIQRAVVYAGLATVKRMVSLTMMASVGDKPTELMRLAIIRARLCELLCKESGHSDPGSAFTVGLFSALDAMMDRPLDELLKELPLASEVSAALLEGEGLLGEVLGLWPVPMSKVTGWVCRFST